MGNFNRVILAGNIGSNINYTTTRSGSEVYNAQLCTNDVWVDGDGQKKDRALWHHLTAYNKTAGQMDRALVKGDTVLIEGKLNYKPRPNGGGVYSEIIVETFHRLRKSEENRSSKEQYDDNYDNGRDDESHHEVDLEEDNIRIFDKD